jgi:hypothetical protein
MSSIRHHRHDSSGFDLLHGHREMPIAMIRVYGHVPSGAMYGSRSNNGGPNTRY